MLVLFHLSEDSALESKEFPEPLNTATKVMIKHDYMVSIIGAHKMLVLFNEKWYLNMESEVNIFKLIHCRQA